MNNQINDFILAGVIASLMGNLYIGFLMEFSYVLLRCYAGGYHARNENICRYITRGTIIGELIVIFRFPTNKIEMNIIMLISVIIIFLKAPVDNVNKPLDKKEHVTQDPFLFKGTVRENVKLGNLSDSIEQIEKVMDKIGILYLADRNIDIEKNDLSGGERQKISIARALLKDSAILLLDEPSNHLDSYTKKWLIEWLRKSDKIVIFTSHDKDLLQISDMQIKL